MGLNIVYWYYKCMCIYINLVIKYDYLFIDGNFYWKFKLWQEEFYWEYLIEVELYLLEQLEIFIGFKYLEKICNMFLFVCYIGLWFGDVVKLAWKYIEEMVKGMQIMMWIEKIRNKYIILLWLLFK